MSKITRRTLARGGALCLVGVMAAPAAPGLAQSDKRRWRMVTSWPKRLPGPVCVPRTSSALISRDNRLTSAHHDRAAMFRTGRLGRAIQVEEPA